MCKWTKSRLYIFLVKSTNGVLSVREWNYVKFFILNDPIVSDVISSPRDRSCAARKKMQLNWQTELRADVYLRSRTRKLVFLRGRRRRRYSRYSWGCA